MDFPTGGPSQNHDHAAVGQSLPGQAQNQRIELPAGKANAAIARPQSKPPLIQPPVRQPDTVAIMYQYLQAIAALIGKDIGMVRLRRTEDPHDLSQDRFRSGSHVERPG